MIRTVPRSIFPHTLGLICLLLHDMPVNFPSLGRVEIGCKIKHKMHAMQFFFLPLKPVSVQTTLVQLETNGQTSSCINTVLSFKKFAVFVYFNVFVREKKKNTYAQNYCKKNHLNCCDAVEWKVQQ